VFWPGVPASDVIVAELPAASRHDHPLAASAVNRLASVDACLPLGTLAPMCHAVELSAHPAAPRAASIASIALRCAARVVKPRLRNQLVKSALFCATV